jgi:hypothetical protein
MIEKFVIKTYRVGGWLYHGFSECGQTWTSIVSEAIRFDTYDSAREYINNFASGHYQVEKIFVK